MTILHIVRHGNTFAAGETPRRIGARTDIPLVATGVAQGEALGRWFADGGIGFDRCLASPLRRTRETAALILRARPNAPDIETADWLAEIDHGPDEGLTDEAIVARIGAGALARWDSDAVPPPGWHVDEARRCAAWRACYAREGRRGSGNLLIVTSNGAARFALLAQPALLAAARALPSLKLRTGASGALSLDRSGTATLLRWDVRP